MAGLLNDHELIERILGHIDNKTTDMGTEVWREPSVNYVSRARFEDEIALMRRSVVPYCPSSMLLEKGSYVARKAAGTPLVVVRGLDGVIRAFINACRHRSMPVASGQGCTRAFKCPYHAWTYSIDGKLKHIADKHGFPDVDPEEHSLLQISAREHGGIIYVNQEREIVDEDFADLPTFFTAEQQYFGQESVTDNTNWKLIAETTMEGYHIKGLHKDSFFPYGLDNTNVVEFFGSNSRVVFPFRRIEKLRDLPVDKRNIDGLVTSVYNLFPNTVVSVLSKHTTLSIFEPISLGLTKTIMYRVTNSKNNDNSVSLEEAKIDADFVKGAGLEEDRAAAVKIQENVTAGRNSHLTFGLFESALVHFHRHLEQGLNEK